MVFELQYTDVAGVTQRKSFSSVGISDSMNVYMQGVDGERTLLKEMARPIVLEGAETLTESVRSIDDLLTPEFIGKLLNNPRVGDSNDLLTTLYRKLDTQTLPLKTALRMHEIMMHSIVNDGYSNVGTHTPVVFKVEVDDRLRVGWHFEKNEQATLGSRGHYDHGLSVSHHTNLDKEIIAVPPMMPEQFKTRTGDNPDGFMLMLNDGELIAGSSSYMRSEDAISVDGAIVPLSEIACITAMPAEQVSALEFKIDTGYPLFDEQTTCILGGDVNGETYISRKIHARDTQGDAGARQNADLISFSSPEFGSFGKWVINTIAELPDAQTNSHQAYVFFTREDNAKKTFGAIIMDSKHHVVAQLAGPTNQHKAAMKHLALQLSGKAYLEQIADKTMIREHHALRTHLTQRRGLENTLSTPGANSNRPKR